MRIPWLSVYGITVTSGTDFKSCIATYKQIIYAHVSGKDGNSLFLTYEWVTDKPDTNAIPSQDL